MATIASGHWCPLDVVGAPRRAEYVQPAATGCVQRGAKRVQRGAAKRVQRDPEPIPAAPDQPWVQWADVPRARAVGLRQRLRTRKGEAMI